MTEVEGLRSREKLDFGKRIISFIGPEGSGKSTMAKNLAEETGKPLVTTGDIIREMAQNDRGTYGDACRKVSKEHAYLDGQTLLEIVAIRLSKKDVADGFILDGGFRTVQEIKDFKKMLQVTNRVMPVTTVSLRIPGWMGVKRLSNNEKARGRDDDSANAVLSRLTRYYDHLGERASLIKKQETWKFLQIDGTRSIEDVYESVVEALSQTK